MAIEIEPIGIIHSPWAGPEDMPIQPRGAKGVRGSVVVDEVYREGLADLDGFSHIILVFHFHLAHGYRLRVVPFIDTVERGIFATRAPKRPNGIGMSVVKLLGVSDGVLEIENVDIVDGTPLLDIKPCVPHFDAAEDMRFGWLGEVLAKAESARADGRFDGEGRG